jgi:hypothetical protein
MLKEAGRWVSRGRAVHRTGEGTGVHSGAGGVELRGEERRRETTLTRGAVLAVGRGNGARGLRGRARLTSGAVALVAGVGAQGNGLAWELGWSGGVGPGHEGSGPGNGRSGPRERRLGPGWVGCWAVPFSFLFPLLFYF